MRLCVRSYLAVIGRGIAVVRNLYLLLLVDGVAVLVAGFARQAGRQCRDTARTIKR